MRHSFFDKYSELDTPIHRMNPKIKLAIFLFFLLLVSFLKIHMLFFLTAFVLLSALFAIARIPFMFIVKRIAVIMPFLIFIIIFIPLFQDKNWAVAGLTFARALLSIMALVLFISTTRFPRLLKDLEDIGVPKMIVEILSFIYRYFFVLVGELERMELAVKARAPGKKHRLLYKGFSSMLGMLIIHSYERSERIYQAMQLRGYDDGRDDE